MKSSQLLFLAIIHFVILSSGCGKIKNEVTNAVGRHYIGSHRYVHTLFKSDKIENNPQNIKLFQYGKQLEEFEYTYKNSILKEKTFFHKNKITGVLVIKDGLIVKEKYLEGNKIDSRWFSFSVSKSIIGILIGMAIEDGYIKSVDDQVTKYIPELNNSAYQGVTIKDLLEMSSGIKWEETKETNRVINIIESDQTGGIIKFLKTLTKEEPPGKSFSYNTGNSFLLGKIISKSSGKTLAQYMSEKLWKPLGMERSAYVLKESDSGDEIGGAGFAMTLRDYGRFGNYVLQELKKDPIKTYIRQSTTPDPSRPYLNYGEVYPWSPLGYGFQWWLFPQQSNQKPEHNGAILAQGLFGQFIYINPKYNIVIVVWSAWPEINSPNRYLWAYDYLGQMVKHIANHPVEK